jgi:hypothetical protein
VSQELRSGSPAEPIEASPQSTDTEQEKSLFFGMSAARLRGRAKWASVVLVLSVLLPYNMIGKTPLFVWDVIAELHLASAFGVLALPLAGLAIIVGLIATKRGSSLAFVVLGSLVTAAIVRKLGSDRTAWDLMALPDSLSSRPSLALITVALVAAAANLKFRRSTARVVPYVLGAATLSALLFYGWPSRGEAPLRTVGRALLNIPELPDFRYQIGLLLLVFVMLWPLAVLAMGFSLLRVTPSKDESWLAIIANWAMSLWLGLLVTRALMMPQPSLSFMSFLATVTVVTAVVVLLSASVVVIVESFFVTHGDEAPLSRGSAMSEEIELADDPFGGQKRRKVAPVRGSAGLEPKKAAIVTGVVVAVLGITELVLARPPTKGTEWETTNEKTAEGDRVFGELVMNWGRARRRWDFATRRDSGTQERLEVKNAGRELTLAAKELDPKLGEAFEALTTESDELDLAGAKWGRLVEAVNDASKAAKLPYFLDPDIAITETEKEGLRYHFFIYPYRIEKVRQYDVDGDDFATLRVKPLGYDRDVHLRLGFSRDEAPFALVLVNETAHNGNQFVSLGRQGYCSDDLVQNQEMYKGLNRCGKLLKDYAEGRDVDIPDAILAGTERHELQHQIDGPHLPIAGPVLNLLEGYAPSSQDRVNREVSAFLAELTTEGMAPKLALVQLAQYLMVSENHPYAKTSIVIFEALTDKKVRRGYYLDGDKFWDAYEKLFDMSDDALRKRAAETWADLYGRPLPEPKAK